MKAQLGAVLQLVQAQRLADLVGVPDAYCYRYYHYHY